MTIETIRLKNKNGNTIDVNMEELRELYFELKKIFNDNSLYVSSTAGINIKSLKNLCSIPEDEEKQERKGIIE